MLLDKNIKCHFPFPIRHPFPMNCILYIFQERKEYNLLSHLMFIFIQFFIKSIVYFTYHQVLSSRSSSKLYNHYILALNVPHHRASSKKHQKYKSGKGFIYSSFLCTRFICTIKKISEKK